MVTIDVEEIPDVERTYNTQVNRSEYPPIFYDAAYGIGITPNYTGVDTVINITYRARSESEARRILS